MSETLDSKIYESEKAFKILSKIAPFLCLVCGRIRQGKTCNVIALYRYLKAHNKFDMEIIVSGSIHKGVWTKNKAPKHAQYEKLNSKQIGALIDYQKKKNAKSKILLILDDVLASTDTRDKEMVGMISILRHLNISIVIVSQKIRGVDPIIRSNADLVILHKQSGQANLNTIYEECLTADVPRREFYDYFNSATDEHKAVVINNTSTNHENKLFIIKCDLQKNEVKDG